MRPVAMNSRPTAWKARVVAVHCTAWASKRPVRKMMAMMGWASTAMPTLPGMASTAVPRTAEARESRSPSRSPPSTRRLMAGRLTVATLAANRPRISSPIMLDWKSTVWAPSASWEARMVEMNTLIGWMPVPMSPGAMRFRAVLTPAWPRCSPQRSR